MGMIQANLNQLMLSAWGSVATLAGIGKKVGEGFKKKPEVDSPKVSSETTGSMGNIVKIGRLNRNKYAQAIAYLSSDSAVDSKAISRGFSISERLAQASSLSVTPKKEEGGKK